MHRNSLSIINFRDFIKNRVQSPMNFQRDLHAPNPDYCYDIFTSQKYCTKKSINLTVRWMKKKANSNCQKLNFVIFKWSSLHFFFQNRSITFNLPILKFRHVRQDAMPHTRDQQIELTKKTEKFNLINIHWADWIQFTSPRKKITIKTFSTISINVRKFILIFLHSSYNTKYNTQPSSKYPVIYVHV
jgi:hypothetical protein